MQSQSWIETSEVWRRRILLFLVVAVPLVFLRFLHDPINVPKLGLLMAGVAVVTTMRAAEVLAGASWTALKRAWIPAAAILIPLLLGWLLSPYRGWALVGHYPRFTGLLPYVVVAVFGILIADAFAGRLTDLAWAFSGAAAVVGLYATVQFIGLDPLIWAVKGTEVDVVASTLGNSNFVGGFLAIALPVVLGLWFGQPARRGAATACLVAITLGWLVSESQGGWAAGIGGVAVVGGVLLADRWRPAVTAGRLVAAAMALGVVGVVLLSMTAIDHPLVPLSMERRGDWWTAAGAMAKDSPIVGSGPSAFALEHATYRTVEDALQVNFDITDDPHNVLLSFLTGTGVLGLVGFAVAAGWTVRRGLALAVDDLIGVAFFGGFCAYLVQALVSVDTVALRTAGWTMIGALAVASIPLAVESRPRKKKKDVVPAHPPLVRVAAGVGALVGLLAFVWAVRFVDADRRFKTAYATLRTGDVTGAQPELEDVNGVRFEPTYLRLEGRDLGEFAIATGLAGERETGEGLLDESREAFSFLDDHPHVNSMVDLARILRDWSSLDPVNVTIDPHKKGRYDPEARREAFALFTRAAELDPVNAPLIGEAADLGLVMGEYEAVIEMLGPVADRVDNPTVWGELAVAYASSGDVDAAERAIDRTLALEPAELLAEEARKILRSSD